jgi:hypothetical protein
MIRGKSGKVSEPITSNRPAAVIESMAKSRSTTVRGSHKKSGEKTENYRNHVKGHRYHGFAPETGFDEDSIHIVFLYL